MENATYMHNTKVIYPMGLTLVTWKVTITHITQFQTATEKRKE